MSKTRLALAIMPFTVCYIEHGAAMHGAGAWAAMHCDTTFDPSPTVKHYAEMTLFLYLKEFLFFQHPPKLKKTHHRSIHNIRLEMIIDIQVFEFSNTCTVRASMVVVRLTSMEALILSVTVCIHRSQPTAGKWPCA